jgi:hypothetical protein
MKNINNVWASIIMYHKIKKYLFKENINDIDSIITLLFKYKLI